MHVSKNQIPYNRHTQQGFKMVYGLWVCAASSRRSSITTSKRLQKYDSRDNNMQTLQERQSKNGVKSRVTLRWGHIGPIQISVDQFHIGHCILYKRCFSPMHRWIIPLKLERARGTMGLILQCLLLTQVTFLIILSFNKQYPVFVSVDELKIV